MSSPSEIVKRKITYKVIQKLTNATEDGFTVQLNPFSFEFSGMCKVYLRSIALRDFTAGNSLLGVEVSLTQPYSQSNMHGTTINGAPKWNPANEIYWSQIGSTATTHNDMDLTSTYMYATLAPTSSYTVRIHNGGGTNFAGSYVGVLIWEIDPVIY
jgi:hypothetical protein